MLSRGRNRQSLWSLDAFHGGFGSIVVDDDGDVTDIKQVDPFTLTAPTSTISGSRQVRRDCFDGCRVLPFD